MLTEKEIRDYIEAHMPEDYNHGRDVLNYAKWKQIVSNTPIHYLRAMLRTKQEGRWNPCLYECAQLKVASIDMNMPSKCPKLLGDVRCFIMHLLTGRRFHYHTSKHYTYHIQYYRRYTRDQ